MAVKYDKDKDYQALIDQAVSSGNYKAAAQYEQQRNAKIADMNASGGGTNKYGATATNKYAGWLDDTDYGAIGRQQMQSGASAEDVLKTYNSRYNKAANTEGMTQYANDGLQKEMWDYITQNAGKPAFDPSQYMTGRPTYEGKYDSRIDEMLDRLLSRDSFKYDASSDPLFQQYQKMYQREGNRAMNDTLASAAAHAGGMNSYAITASQQAGDYYNAQLGDKIPELYQLAYSMYVDDIDRQVQDLGLLRDMDNAQYNRYRDTMSDWRNDRDFAYGAYRDKMGDWQWNQNFDYNMGRDQISDSRYDREWDYNVGRDQISDSRYENETAYQRALQLLQAGVMPDGAMLAKAGLSKSQAATMLAAAQASVGASARPADTGAADTGAADTTDDDTAPADEKENDRFWQSVRGLGLGDVSATLVQEIADFGGIIEKPDGTVAWAPGWNAENYHLKMGQIGGLPGYYDGISY